MKRNRRERGEGQFGCLVGLVLLALAGLIAYRMIPVKVKSAEMRDHIVDESKSAGQHNDAQIRKSIMAKAEQLEIPMRDEDLKIDRRNEIMRIEATYTMPVQFPGYTYQWKFRHRTENPIF